MSKAVRFSATATSTCCRSWRSTGPCPAPGRWWSAVKAAGINPGEAAIRSGCCTSGGRRRSPRAGQRPGRRGRRGGRGVTGFAVGDEVIGFTHDRASQAESSSSMPTTSTPARRRGVGGGRRVVRRGSTAYAAVRAVAPGEGRHRRGSGRGGGVGSMAVQLAVRTGATVIGLASAPHHGWLRATASPVAHGDGVAERFDGVRRTNRRVRRPVRWRVRGPRHLARYHARTDRHDRRLAAAALRREDRRQHGRCPGRRTRRAGRAHRRWPPRCADCPYPSSAQVQEAYRELEQRHTLGKIVLVP